MKKFIFNLSKLEKSEKEKMYDMIFSFCCAVGFSLICYIFICRLLVSLQLLDKIEVYLFQFSEKEVGFHDLLERVFQLQSSMNKTVVFHCNSSAATHIDELVQKRVQRGMFFYNVVSSNELLMASEPDVHNLYLLFMSRPGGVSYSALQLSFQKKMALNPIDFNFVLCYPRTGSDVQ